MCRAYDVMISLPIGMPIAAAVVMVATAGRWLEIPAVRLMAVILISNDPLRLQEFNS